MRVKQPEPFDPNREYSPGERCVYRGMVLIAEIWTAADARLANNNPAIFTQRCVRCKIKREDCPGNKRRGFAVYIHEITKVWQCPGKPVNLPRG